MELKIYSNEKEMFFKMEKGIQVITPKFKNGKVIDYNITYNWDGDNIYKLTNRLNNLVDKFYLLQFNLYDMNIYTFETIDLKEINRNYNQFFTIKHSDITTVSYEKTGYNYYLDNRYYSEIPEQIRDIVLTNIFNYRNDKLIQTKENE